ncbi:phage late control D family protein [Pseudomonas cremoricolorata]|uniref:phage late control D family protein n=1 Tax=Pseudomonas cremoricolorata TaxID=157783 RepID=UPI00042713AF|nr:phage late control D family protein [Pseudomonas cremoricolorata]
MNRSSIGYLGDLLRGVTKDAAQQIPAFRLSVDGIDIAAKISQRLLSLELTDNRGLEADQLSLSLSDHDGLLAVPPRGAVIRLWLGWSDTGLVDKGSYTVDETEHSGAPDILSIRARSADLRQGLKRKRERSWSQRTLGHVLEDIAAAHGLQPSVTPALAALAITQLDQANESDANLLTRLGEDFDAVVTVKAGRLICMPTGAGQTAGGLDLPHITLKRSDGDQHRFLAADRDSYDGVRAYYYDVNRARKQQAIAGGGDNLKDLRHTYSDQPSALRAARSELNRLQRGSATLSYTLARGRPELIPELTYTLQGIKAPIDEIVWHGGNVRHSLNADTGYTVSLELESKLPLDTVDALLEYDGRRAYTGVLAFYRNAASGREQSVTVADQAYPKRLRRVYVNEHNARRAAEREWQRLQDDDAGN